jgi:hypothetical protein
MMMASTREESTTNNRTKSMNYLPRAMRRKQLAREGCSGSITHTCLSMSSTFAQKSWKRSAAYVDQFSYVNS